MSSDGTGDEQLAFLAGGGEVGHRLRTLDWSRTALGSPAHWPQSLKTIVRVMLDSRYAMWMAWGPDLTFFCNDAYLPTVGLKRDWVLGSRSDQVWKEIWPDIGPRIDYVLADGHATWDEGLLLFLERSGFTEESYHTFSYSPVYDDQNRIAGMLCVVTEVTERVVSERRLRVLHDVAAQVVGAESVAASCERALKVLASHPTDLPFSALYLIEPDGRSARLAGTSRPLPPEWFPPKLSISERMWRLDELLAQGRRQEVNALPQRGLQVTAGLWPDHVQQAMVLPIKSSAQEPLLGLLIAGVSPRRPFDDGYSSFLDLIASQLAAGIANAQAYESERERARALAAIDRAKTIFFSNVSHEFRTPLTLMLGPVEDMAADEKLPQAVRARLDIVHRNSRRLLRLVNSLLEFSRIEAGRVQANYEPTDLAMLTRDLVSTFGSTLELAGLSLTQRLQSLSEPVYVDREMWERIVLNLLSNAFKYTLQGEIEVRLWQTQGRAVLSVRDTGIGIPQEAIPNLFDRFYRVEGAEGRTHEGTGIGLALVYELVKMHSGVVGVESRLGQGTLFTVSIPLGREHLAPERVVAARPLTGQASAAREYVQEALRWLPESVPGKSGHARALDSVTELPSLDSQPRAATAARVLVADDNADMRAYVRELLESRFVVETVADGQAALDSALRSPPDLIVSDVMMPRMDGFELLRALRSNPRLSEIPTILLSARAGEESVIEGLEALADDYLVKPFAARELLARVGAQLQLAGLRREAAGREQILRQQAETLLREAPVGVYVVDDQLRIRAANATTRQLLGEVGELIGASFADLIRRLWTREYADEVVRRFQHTLATGKPYVSPLRAEQRLDRKVTEYYEWRISRIPLPEHGYGVVCYLMDVSSHVQVRMALEAADRQKNEFLAMLAHELRNPLAPIRNASEILARTLGEESTAQAAIGMVKRQVAQLTRLVDDLLDVSRITQGRVELKREPLELGSVVGQAVEMVEPLFRERNHEVALVSSYKALYVNGDVTRLVQSIVNILTNAAKYTDTGGQISVQTRVEGPNALVEISDNGAGIAPELLPRVFELFVQGDRTLDRSLGGLGIGLSVARQLVEMHGGRVAAASPGLGKGATFKIWLPLMERPGEREAAAEQAPAPPRRILVVDDNVDAADSLALVLNLDGHTTEAVYSARAALERAVTFKPHVILLDIGLPEMDGYEVARRLRAFPELREARLVALTGYGQAEDLRRAEEAGFDDHLVKPVDFATLGRCMAGEDTGSIRRAYTRNGHTS